MHGPLNVKFLRNCPWNVGRTRVVDYFENKNISKYLVELDIPSFSVICFISF
jgi:hypothetical protein